MLADDVLPYSSMLTGNFARSVFKFAVKKVPEVIGELLQKADLTEKDIDLFVLHQANLRIIESVAKRMKKLSPL